MGNVKPGSGARSTVLPNTFGFEGFSGICPVNLLCTCVYSRSNLWDLGQLTFSLYSQFPLMQK